MEENLLDVVILGEPASKSNSRRIVKSKNSGNRISIKSKKALSYSESFKKQIAQHMISPPLSGDLAIYVNVWYASRRPDLDIELIKDLLQGVVYLNDRQIKEQHSKHHLDKDNPRCRIVLRRADPNHSIL